MIREVPEILEVRTKRLKAVVKYLWKVREGKRERVRGRERQKDGEAGREEDKDNETERERQRDTSSLTTKFRDQSQHQGYPCETTPHDNAPSRNYFRSQWFTFRKANLANDCPKGSPPRALRQTPRLYIRVKRGVPSPPPPPPIKTCKTRYWRSRRARSPFFSASILRCAC